MDINFGDFLRLNHGRVINVCFLAKTRKNEYVFGTENGGLIRISEADLIEKIKSGEISGKGGMRNV